MPEETTTGLAEFSLADYRNTRESAPTEEQKPSEAPAAEEPEVKTEPEAETGNKEQEPDEEGDDEKPAKRKGGWQRRIDRLTTEKRELESRLAALEAKSGGEKPAESAPQPQGKPSVENFETYDAYVEALADWKLEQRIAAERHREEEAKAKAQQQDKLSAWGEKVKAAEGRYDDFEEVAYNPAVRITMAMQEAILESPVGPDLAYWLGSHPQDAARIADLSPISQARELGKIEASLATPETKKPKPSAAPAPIKPVSTAAAPSTKKPESMDYQEYRQWRQAGGGR